MDDEIMQEWKQGSYQYPLEDCLLKALERWRSDRCASWANEIGSNDILDKCEYLSDIIQPFEKQEIFKKIEEFAQIILNSRPGAGDSGPLTELGVEGDYYYGCRDFIQYTKESVQTYLAEALVNKLGEAASRLVDLAEDETFRIEGLKLTESAKGFLRLVINSYVWDFNAPCIIICRSVIEDVLRSKIDYDTCEKHLGKRLGRQQGFSLADYIDVARHEGFINEKLAKMAHGIRERANKVLHNDPRLTEKTEESISQTVRILCMLETGKDPREL